MTLPLTYLLLFLAIRKPADIAITSAAESSGSKSHCHDDAIGGDADTDDGNNDDGDAVSGAASDLKRGTTTCDLKNTFDVTATTEVKAAEAANECSSGSEQSSHEIFSTGKEKDSNAPEDISSSSRSTVTS